MGVGGVDLEGMGNEYYQNPLCEILKELVKCSEKIMLVIIIVCECV